MNDVGEEKEVASVGESGGEADGEGKDEEDILLSLIAMVVPVKLPLPPPVNGRRAGDCARSKKGLIPAAKSCSTSCVAPARYYLKHIDY